jgi:hypothetical protein
MNLSILRIVDRGIRNKERLHLSVLADGNLTYYGIFDTEYSGRDAIITPPKRAYWFADYPVKAGDHVILYTKRGTSIKKDRSDGFANHFFYWNLDKTLWGNPQSCAVLLEIADWETSNLEAT